MMIVKRLWASYNGKKDGKECLPIPGRVSSYLDQIKSKFDKKANSLKQKWNKKDKKLRESWVGLGVAGEVALKNFRKAEKDYSDAQNGFEAIKTRYKSLQLSLSEKEVSWKYWLIIGVLAMLELPLNFSAFQALRDSSDLFSYLTAGGVGCGIILAAHIQGKCLLDTLLKRKIFIAIVFLLSVILGIGAISYVRIHSFNHDSTIAVAYGIISFLLYIVAIGFSYHSHPPLYPDSIEDIRKRSEYIESQRRIEQECKNLRKQYEQAKKESLHTEKVKKKLLYNYEITRSKFEKVKSKRISTHTTLRYQIDKLNSSISELCSIYWTHNSRHRMKNCKDSQKDIETDCPQIHIEELDWSNERKVLTEKR